MKIPTQNFTVIYNFLVIIDNSALNGGVIKASDTIVILKNSVFEYNIAYYGGVMQIDNDAQLTANRVTF